VIVGTAGHIDHGKSSLVKALTGIDTDRLKEEKARGISIELGYAFMSAGEHGESSSRSLGFVDVPGHERFVHHMLAGATGIDFVMLVIAADDGPMPQTREHLQIVELLGLKSGLVALTKIDMVSEERVRHVEAEVRALLEDTALAGAEVLKVSSHSGEGIEALRSRLREAAEATPPRSRAGHFRLAIDRCFTLPGAGTIVTGTAHAGFAKVGDRVMVSPSGIEVRIRSIHAQNREAEACWAGQRCALNLTGLHFEKSDIQRGEWVVSPGLHKPTANLDVSLHILPGESQPLKHLTQVHCHLGAEHVTGRVVLLDCKELRPGMNGLARITLARQIGALQGDHFVIRDGAASRTLGGGTVLDPFPPQRGRRNTLRLELLNACRDGGPRGMLDLQLRQDASEIDLTRFIEASNLTEAEAQALYATLPMKRYRGDHGDMAVSLQAWQAGRHEIVEMVRQEHINTPEDQGPTRERLRKLGTRRWSPSAFNFILSELIGSGALCSRGLSIHLPGHEARMPGADVALWTRITPLFAAKPYAPPRVDQIARQLGATEKSIRSVLSRAAQSGEGYMVGEDRFYPLAVLIDIARRLKVHAADGAGRKGVSAAMMRDVLGIGRNIVIEILEFFDRVGYTRRVGDLHLLRSENADLFDRR
jgi:selenocysteine-specific elongation factor